MGDGVAADLHFFEDLEVGQTAEASRVVRAEDIDAFAQVSGDDNPIHLDDAYASTTSFGGRVAHGMLSAAFISAVIGRQLPGPGAIYLTQSLRFRAPVRPGDEVTVRVTVQSKNDRRGMVTLDTACQVGGRTVVDGEALVMVPRRG